jgi:hypothetical protein
MALAGRQSCSTPPRGLPEKVHAHDLFVFKLTRQLLEI